MLLRFESRNSTPPPTRHARKASYQLLHMPTLFPISERDAHSVSRSDSRSQYIGLCLYPASCVFIEYWGLENRREDMGRHSAFRSRTYSWRAGQGVVPLWSLRGSKCLERGPSPKGEAWESKDRRLHTAVLGSGTGSECKNPETCSGPAPPGLFLSRSAYSVLQYLAFPGQTTLLWVIL